MRLMSSALCRSNASSSAAEAALMAATVAGSPARALAMPAADPNASTKRMSLRAGHAPSNLIMSRSCPPGLRGAIASGGINAEA